MWSRISRCYKLLYLTKRCYSLPVTKYHYKTPNHILQSSHRFSTKEVTHVEFEQICNETLESLSEFFDALVESKQELKGADVTYSDGVLTVFLGKGLGTYVINRQSPNKQIWLSSPNSGPKRYDYDPERKTWIYKHDNKPLHTLLKHELSAMLNDNIDISQCTFSEKNI